MYNTENSQCCIPCILHELFFCTISPHCSLQKECFSSVGMKNLSATFNPSFRITCCQSQQPSSGFAYLERSKSKQLNGIAASDFGGQWGLSSHQRVNVKMIILCW